MFERLSALWSRWSMRKGVVPLLLVCLWALAVFPNLSVRSFVWEEGTNAEIARDIVATGNLLEPMVYGTRWNEKPSLLPWMIAGVAKVTGEVNEFSARLPAMIAVILTALLVQAFTRRYASLNASLLAALMFMFSPMLLQKLAISEPDTLITLFSFAAFVLWRTGAEPGRVGVWRWIGCGFLLALVAMAKGPQPVGYFALGVGTYLLATRRWRHMPGLILCLLVPAAASVAWAAAVYQPGDGATWISYARLNSAPSLTSYLARNARTALNLLLELLPSILLAPLLFLQTRRDRQKASIPAVALPLALYASICTIAVILWPGTNSRYAMPCAPALAVLAGLAWDAMKHVALRRAAVVVTAVLVAGQIVLSIVVLPLLSERFGASRTAGQAIERAIRADPAPVFSTDLATNQLFYAREPIHYIEASKIAAVVPPAWLIIPKDTVGQLTSVPQGTEATIVVETKSGADLVAARIRKAVAR